MLSIVRKSSHRSAVRPKVVAVLPLCNDRDLFFHPSLLFPPQIDPTSFAVVVLSSIGDFHTISDCFLCID